MHKTSKTNIWHHYLHDRSPRLPSQTNPHWKMTNKRLVSSADFYYSVLVGQVKAGPWNWALSYKRCLCWCGKVAEVILGPVRLYSLQFDCEIGPKCQKQSKMPKNQSSCLYGQIKNPQAWKLMTPWRKQRGKCTVHIKAVENYLCDSCW